MQKRGLRAEFDLFIRFLKPRKEHAFCLAVDALFVMFFVGIFSIFNSFVIGKLKPTLAEAEMVKSLADVGMLKTLAAFLFIVGLAVFALYAMRSCFVWKYVLKRKIKLKSFWIAAVLSALLLFFLGGAFLLASIVLKVSIVGSIALMWVAIPAVFWFCGFLYASLLADERFDLARALCRLRKRAASIVFVFFLFICSHIASVFLIKIFGTNMLTSFAGIVLFAAWLKPYMAGIVQDET